VNVSFANDKQSEWTSLSGKAEVVNDRQQAVRLWAAPLKTWFPGGLDTEGLSLIKVHVDSAGYWGRPRASAAADRCGAGSGDQ
jgi:general stress protein 26